jgi:hypothetical protein
MPPELEALYSTVIDNISSPMGQCVLILGPELSINQEGIGYKKYFRRVVGPEDTESKYLENDNLFYFKDNYRANLIKGKIKKFYKNVGDPALLELIARIPFPLIINVCPDVALNNVYETNKIDFEPAHFAPNNKAKFMHLAPPSKEKPWIYNIFGTIDTDQSLILTHAQLYTTIEYLLPEKTLPDHLETYLNSTANSYLFLGFKFDSWYYQLVCHRLGIYPHLNRTNTICTPNANEDDHVNVVMKKSFGMNFSTENPSQFIYNLVKRLDSNMLRKPGTKSPFSTFVSYAWSDTELQDRANIIKVLEQNFAEQQPGPWTLYTDRKDQHHGESIDAFMHTIGLGKTVIMVVSDKYLTSSYCMTEALRVADYRDDEQRVFMIIMDDAADIMEADLREAVINNYKDIWWKKCEREFRKKKSNRRDRLQSYMKIYDFIEEFIERIADTKALILNYSDVFKIPGSDGFEVSAAKSRAYKDFMKDVYLKLKED